jgi:hypothetical protein
LLLTAKFDGGNVIRMKEPSTISQIFDEFGGPARVARLLGVKPSTASEMKRRSAIPIKYWEKLVYLAPDKNMHLTPAILLALHSASSEHVAS